MRNESDSDLSEELNDQLSQLWDNSRDKRRQMLSQLTPYSKRNQQSFNSSLTHKEKDLTSFAVGEKSGLEQEVVRLRGQLEHEVQEGRHKD